MDLDSTLALAPPSPPEAHDVDVGAEDYDDEVTRCVPGEDESSARACRADDDVDVDVDVAAAAARKGREEHSEGAGTGFDVAGGFSPLAAAAAQSSQSFPGEESPVRKKRRLGDGDGAAIAAVEGSINDEKLGDADVSAKAAEWTVVVLPDVPRRKKGPGRPRGSKNGSGKGGRQGRRGVACAVRYAFHSFVLMSTESLGAEVEEDDRGGCVVSRVEDGGQAEALGIRSGDVIFAATAIPPAASASGGGGNGGGSRPQHAEEVVVGRAAIRYDDFVTVAQSNYRPLRLTVRREVAGVEAENNGDGGATTAATAAENDEEAAPTHHETVIHRSESSSPQKCSEQLLRAMEARDEARRAKDLSTIDVFRANEALGRTRALMEEARRIHNAAREKDDANARRLGDADRLVEEEEILQRSAPFDVMYRKLCRFKQRHGHTWVTKSLGPRRRRRRRNVESVAAGDDAADSAKEQDVEEGPSAGGGENGSGTEATPDRGQQVEDKFIKWVKIQRTQYRQYVEGKQVELKDEEKSSSNRRSTRAQRILTPARAELLKKIGFELTADEMKNGPEWDSMYEKLAAYRLEHGHCTVSRKVDRDLSNWATRQWEKYKEGTLPQDKVNSMEKLGFTFVRKSLNERWEEMFARLTRYKHTHGHCNVPSDYKEDKELGTWVVKQRATYKDPNATVSPHRVAALEEIGFTWYVLDTKWSQRIAELTAYRDQFGDCNVSRGNEKYRSLAKWVQSLRNQYTKFQDGQHSQLTLEKIQTLNEMGFKWSMRAKRPREATIKTEEQIWFDRYQEVQAFSEKYGHCKLSNKKCRSSHGLKAWAAHQRTQYRLFQEGRPANMTAQRIVLLEKLGFEWIRADWRQKAAANEKENAHVA